MLYTAIGIPLLVTAFMRFLDHKTWNIMKLNTKDFKNDMQAVNYILNLVDLVENRGLYFISLLSKLLNFHRKTCTKNKVRRIA